MRRSTVKNVLYFFAKCFCLLLLDSLSNLWHAVITQEAYNLFFFGKTCQTHDHYSTTRQSHIGYIYTYQFFICSSILPISVQQVTEAIRSLTL
jgi:hypothetical protein